jgi:hypothetical protein
MKTSHLTESTKIAKTQARPQQETNSARSVEVAALRDKVKNLGKNIPAQEVGLSPNEELLSTDESEEVTTPSEIEPSELLAKASEYGARASENGAAYETVLKELAQGIKQEIASDDQHSELVKEQFKHQAKAGQEAMAFWGDEKKFWTDQLKAGPVESENKEKVGKLYDQVFALETQINSLFGGGSKDEKESLKSKLAAVKDQVSAIRSRAGA